MTRSLNLVVLLTCTCWSPMTVLGDHESAPVYEMTSQALADWIDQRFAGKFPQSGQGKSAGQGTSVIVDDATFLRRISLDLQGRIPSVAQYHDFLSETDPDKRAQLVNRLLTSDAWPERYASRTAAHLARVWRRMMIPASSPNAQAGRLLEPWLARQFRENRPYNAIARTLLLATPTTAGPARLANAPEQDDSDTAAGAFQAAIGPSPENLTSAYARVFLGIRLQCAQCHDHPLAEWTREDFWGLAALLNATSTTTDIPRIRPASDEVTFTARFLWASEPPTLPPNTPPRAVFAEWMVAPENRQFAATAVNRTWEYLCGRGLTESVDNLDLVSQEERALLDELAQLFVASGFDVQWLISGICQSHVYQQPSHGDCVTGEAGPSTGRPLKTLLPEQVFDSLEQALGLPAARSENSPRFNGERDRFVARMNEAAPESPRDFKAGVPQALMLMNGPLISDATSLETSRTLRAIADAPFLPATDKIETLYLAVLTRPPTSEEMAFLLAHVNAQRSPADQQQALAEILWGVLNSPEFVLNP